MVYKIIAWVLWNCSQLNPMPQISTLISRHVNSCDGLVTSGNKPLPKPLLTQIYVVIWRHQATKKCCAEHDTNTIAFCSIFHMTGQIYTTISGHVETISANGRIRYIRSVFYHWLRSYWYDLNFDKKNGTWFNGRSVCVTHLCDKENITYV